MTSTTNQLAERFQASLESAADYFTAADVWPGILQLEFDDGRRG